MTLASLDELQRTASRILDAFGEQITERREVVWLDQPSGRHRLPADTAGGAARGRPGCSRARLFGRAHGGTDLGHPRPRRLVRPLAIAVGFGLPRGERSPQTALLLGGPSPQTPLGGTQPRARDTPRGKQDPGAPRAGPGWTSARRSTIRAAASCTSRGTCPSPAATGCPRPTSPRLRELIGAAGRPDPGPVLVHAGGPAGRRGAARTISQPLLCQGEDIPSQLVRQFTEDEPTCLFGTLSLWQGVDVPAGRCSSSSSTGSRSRGPDDPLASARQRAVAARGGNGFMTVAASQAALLLAQGAAGCCAR